MRESLPEFCYKNESRVHGYAFDPLFRQIGAYRLIKRCVDFDSVEEFREIARFMETARPSSGINDTCPIGVRPARRADKNLRRGEFGSRFGHEGFGARV